MLADEPMQPSENGLLLIQAAKDDRDKYFESSDDLRPIHSNLYIPSDSEGVARVNGKIVDIVDNLAVIFDRPESDVSDDEYPFDEIIISFTPSKSTKEIKVWSITSTAARMLELATVGKIRHADNPHQIVVNLPTWMTEKYRQEVPGFNFKYTPTYTYKSCLSVRVIGSGPFTLAVHASILENEKRTRIYQGPSKNIAVDRWMENQAKYGALRVITLGVEHVLPEAPPAIKIRFPNKTNGIISDFMFKAVDQEGHSIPIKYFRVVHGSANYLLSINTAQLKGYNSPDGYLYSHLPGKFNTSKLDLQWEVEFFTPQTQITVYVYPRIWNFVSFSCADVNLLFA